MNQHGFLEFNTRHLFSAPQLFLLETVEAELWHDRHVSLPQTQQPHKQPTLKKYIDHYTELYKHTTLTHCYYDLPHSVMYVIILQVDLGFHVTHLHTVISCIIYWEWAGPAQQRWRQPSCLIGISLETTNTRGVQANGG